jgi:colicin import membrane protein
MKTPMEQLEEAKAAMAEQTKQIDALAEKLKGYEDDEEKRKKDDEDAKKKAEEKKKEEADAKKKAEEDDEEKDKAIAALADQVKALDAFIKSPEFRASCVGGSPTGTPEGGTSGNQTMTTAEALAAYNKIDPNDSKARAAFRVEHKAALGL